MIKRVRYWFEFVFIALFARIVPLLPLRLLHGLASLLGWLVYHLDRRSRLVALANLEAAFGNQYTLKERERIARQSVQAFGRSFLELFWSPRLNGQNIHRYVRFADEKRFEAMLSTKQEQPVIGTTIHFGNFEWGSALFGFRGYDGYVLMQRFKNDRLTALFQSFREVSGQKSVTQEQSMIRFFKALKRGIPVGILIDLTLKMSDPGLILRAFGLCMRTTMMHTVLQERTKQRIFPFITVADAQGYTVHLLDFIEFSASASRDEIAQTCWNRFEPFIRQHPEQWLWSYKHWRYRPPVDGERYPFYANQSELFDAEFSKKPAATPASERKHEFAQQDHEGHKDKR
jgi:KDO2-lipid IV(A) lauroyltransferase